MNWQIENCWRVGSGRQVGGAPGGTARAKMTASPIFLVFLILTLLLPCGLDPRNGGDSLVIMRASGGGAGDGA